MNIELLLQALSRIVSEEFGDGIEIELERKEK